MRTASRRIFSLRMRRSSLVCSLIAKRERTSFLPSLQRRERTSFLPSLQRRERTSFLPSLQRRERTPFLPSLQRRGRGRYSLCVIRGQKQSMPETAASAPPVSFAFPASPRGVCVPLRLFPAWRVPRNSDYSASLRRVRFASRLP